MNELPSMETELSKRILELRQAFQMVGRSNPTSRAGRLAELRHVLLVLAGDAGESGLKLMEQLCSATAALAHELQSQPEKVNASTLRSLAQSLDTLALLADDLREAALLWMPPPFSSLMTSQSPATPSAQH